MPELNFVIPFWNHWTEMTLTPGAASLCFGGPASHLRKERDYG